MRRLLVLALLTAACASEPADDLDFEFDDAAYSDEASAGCAGKCDSSGDWTAARLGSAAEAPPMIESGWSRETNDRWNNLDQGVMFIPYSWVLALERADGTEPFLTAASVARWGLLAGRVNAWNPDGLPVGIAVHERAGRRYMGFTCAGCHTAEVRVGSVTMRIAGGQGQQDMLGFGDAIADTFIANLRSPRKAYRLVRRILAYEGIENSLSVARDVFDALLTFGKSAWHSRGLYPVRPGPGRLDALGKGGNRAFGQFIDADNYQETYANVSLPPLWDAARFDWTNYNGSVRQALARNTVEALSVGADMVLRDGDGALFETSVNFASMVWLEDAIRTLRSPVWPAEFGAVDPALVERGRRLYDETCGGCHGERDGDRIVPFPGEGGDGIGLKFFPVDEIGTDPTAADAFADRTVVLSPALYRALGIAPGTRVRAVEAFAAVTDGVLGRWFDQMGYSAAERDRLRHGRANEWRAVRAYRARPLNGIWSTAPFLHNGSVPDLVQLLGPAERRQVEFAVGGNQLDPRTLGLGGGAATLDTRLAGNANTGHVFSAAFDASRPFTAQRGAVGRALDDGEIRALVEFMKVIEPL